MLKSGQKGYIKELIMKKIEDSKPNTVFFISDFLEFGSPETIRKIFIQAVFQDKLSRASKGIYIKPKKSKYGIVPPSLEEIAEAVAKRDNCQIIPTGYTAANIIGISTQVPMNHSYITSGTARTLKIDNRKIIFKHGMPKNFAAKGTLVPLLVHGIKEIGINNLTENNLLAIKNFIGKTEDPHFKNDLLNAPNNIRILINRIILTENEPLATTKP